MKKLIACLLACILCLAPLTAYAENDIPEEMNIMMGDVNLDGKVTAMDARNALRYAARLEPSEGVEMLSIDADGDGRISASDARSILRVAAKISQFITGFDGKGTPSVINTMRSNIYFIEVENFDSGKAESMKFSIARNKADVYMITDDVNMIGEMGLGGMMTITKCGMMLKGEDIYAIMGTEKANIAMFIAKEMQEEREMTPDSLYELTDMIDDFLPAELGTPVKTQLNGKDMFCYTYEALGQQCQLYISTNGVLSHIDGVMQNGDVETLLTFSKISGDKTDKYFSLDSYDEIW